MCCRAAAAPPNSIVTAPAELKRQPNRTETVHPAPLGETLLEKTTTETKQHEINNPT
jgi:hypothetical protein